jgi:septal ring-binding cell division protein DamX
MPFIKSLVIFILSISILNANNKESIVYVEDKDNKNVHSIKEAFFNENTSQYTLSVAVLVVGKHNPIEFFKTYKMKNALAYKFGNDLAEMRVISGVYDNYKKAKVAMRNLDTRLLENKPYPISLKRHQEQFKKYNTSYLTNNTPRMDTFKNIPNKTIYKKNQKSIYISGSKESINLKNELLGKKSKLYAISVATVSSSPKFVDDFFKTYNISDKALGHVFGKKKDKVRVIYGLYSSYNEAKNEIKKLDSRLVSNKPYVMKMKSFQSFYKKNNKIKSNENIIKLKVLQKEQKEIGIIPTLSENIKLLKNDKKIKTKIETKKFKEIVQTKTIKESKKKNSINNLKQKKKLPIKKIVKHVSSSKNKYLKLSKFEDIYYLEQKGSFNILDEVFLNDGSSFYTIDLGEIKEEEITIERFLIKNGLNDNTLAYKYGDKKELARVIYGAYETKEDAQKAVKTLNTLKNELKISNIKNHQNLYKTYHKELLKRTVKSNTKDIVFLQNQNQNQTNKLKKIFLSDSSYGYTITLITFHKNDLTPEHFFISSNLNKNILAFSLGTQNNYYRVLYGVYKTSKEALLAIEKLDYELLKNKPYVSRISTSKKRFESYNNRRISNYKNNTLKIEIE